MKNIQGRTTDKHAAAPIPGAVVLCRDVGQAGQGLNLPESYCIIWITIRQVGRENGDKIGGAAYAADKGTGCITEKEN